MKIENQVCSLEQARKLNKMKVSFDSMFFHCSHMKVWNVYHKSQLKTRGIEIYYVDTHTEMCIDAHLIFPAYTAAELGVMLPEKIKEKVDRWSLNYSKWNRKFNVSLNELSAVKHSENLYVEAQSRAAMLIYLLENNLTTAQEVNARLTTH